MNRETAYKVSQSVEKFLKNKENVSAESLAVMSDVARDTLGKTQGRIAIDFSRIASKAGKELSAELSDGLFQLANNTWYDHQRNDMFVVPDGTVFFHRQGTQILLTVQQKPQVRTVYYKPSNDGEGERYRLSVPYVLFIFNIGQFLDGRGQTRYKIDGGRMGFLREPLTELNQNVYVPCLPNIDTTTGGREALKICQGRNYHPEINRSINERIEQYISHFWTTPFGKDWAHEFNEMPKRDERFKIENWHKISQDSPLFILGQDVPYREAGRFSDIIQIDIQPDNKLSAPLRKLLEKAVTRLSELAVTQLGETQIVEDFNPQSVNKAMHAIMSKLVRECVEEVTQEMVVMERGKFASEQEKLEAGLNGLLTELQKRVSGSEVSTGYWGK